MNDITTPIAVTIHDSDIKLKSMGGKLPNGRPLLAWVEIEWRCGGRLHPAPIGPRVVEAASPADAEAARTLLADLHSVVGATSHVVVDDTIPCDQVHRVSTLPGPPPNAMQGMQMVQGLLNGGVLSMTCGKCHTPQEVKRGSIVVAAKVPNRHERRRLAKVNGGGR
jgi:hypothetical protein